jgi:hypothetical protein
MKGYLRPVLESHQKRSIICFLSKVLDIITQLCVHLSDVRIQRLEIINQLFRTIGPLTIPFFLSFKKSTIS